MTLQGSVLCSPLASTVFLLSIATQGSDRVDERRGVLSGRGWGRRQAELSSMGCWRSTEVTFRDQRKSRSRGGVFVNGHVGFGTQYTLLTRPERLRIVAEDLVAHFVGRGFTGKATYVGLDKAAAVRMYDYV